MSFRAALLRTGISVAGRPMTGQADDEALPLASIESVPLEAIMRFMDHESDNFTAEILLKQLGAALSGQGTTASGAAVIRQLLQEQRIPLSGVRIVDGSGLSRLDRLTTSALVELAGRGSARDPDRRTARRGPQRYAPASHARLRGGRSGPREDRHAERGLGALRV